MRFLTLVTGLLALAPALLADLTVDQKLADFNQLAALYAKNYGPYELKRDVYGFDLLNITSWLDQVKASKTDIEFYDICVRYVAALQDSHDEYTIRSTYDAWLHFDGDIYEGKMLIDYIDRSYLPASKFPFRIGDELVSVDGVSVADLLKKFAPYAVNGSSNPVSRNRLSAGTITERYQTWNPRAPEISTNATIVVNRAATGTQDTYMVPWDVVGDAVTTAGLFPSPKLKQPARPDREARRRNLARRRGTETPEDGSDPFNALFSAEPTGEIPVDPPVPGYMKALTDLRTMSALEGGENFGTGSGLFPFGSTIPVFYGALPTNFRFRLGLARTDQFVSGTFTNSGKTIGFIRIWTMSPSNSTLAYTQFAAEMQYFQQNVDGLVVDVMGNGGGNLCYTQDLASMLIPGVFRGTSYQIRATLFWKTIFSSSIISAKNSGAPGWVIADYQFLEDAIDSALKDNRARTGSVPICSYGFDSNQFFDAKGQTIVYSKPLIVLTDNYTLSAGEAFAMFLQDNNRGRIVGTTTDGGGGNVNSYSNATAYSEGNTRITQSVLERLNPVQVPGFPSLGYYDGVGIYPDYWLDFMTVANLNSSGAEFLKEALAQLSLQMQ